MRFDQAIAALLEVADDVIKSTATSEVHRRPDPAFVEQLAAAARALHAAHRAAAARSGEDTPANVRLVQQAADLARLLQQYWQLPEQQAAARLELAQAAATRSCAYLGCANLGGSGGPAEGEGEGSKKCTVCRVSYCGEACSHADWRAGGRRKVCQALAAERQAQKEWARAEQREAV